MDFLMQFSIRLSYTKLDAFTDLSPSVVEKMLQGFWGFRVLFPHRGRLGVFF